MKKFLLALSTLMLVLCIQPPAFAHHSFAAEFDGNKEVKVTGVITKIDWINPHVYIYLDVKDDSGNVTNWALETLPTGFLRRMGVFRDMFSVGQTLTVEGYHAKDSAKALMQIKSVTLPDNRKFVMFIYNDNR